MPKQSSGAWLVDLDNRRKAWLDASRSMVLQALVVADDMNQAILDQIRDAIQQAIPDAKADVTSGASTGHFNLTVTAALFAGKPMVQAHRLVYSAIAHLMDGKQAPVHAIDLLRTLSP